MRTVIKAIALLASICMCTCMLIAVRLLLLFLPYQRKQLTALLVHACSKLYTYIMGIRVNVCGSTHLLRRRGVFFVSNHLSYVDGIVATSLAPLVFIAKADIRSWPFFGIFTLLSDTIFVDRTSHVRITAEISRIIASLRSRVNVIFFPEGTSTNGERLLPFKSAFFAAPQQAEADIVPLVFSYQSVGGEPLGEHNRDLVYWYGDMEFFPHLLKLLSFSGLEVTVTVCQECRYSEFSQLEPSLMRKFLRDKCWQAIEYRRQAEGLKEKVQV